MICIGITLAIFSASRKIPVANERLHIHVKNCTTKWIIFFTNDILMLLLSVDAFCVRFFTIHFKFIISYIHYEWIFFLIKVTFFLQVFINCLLIHGLLKDFLVVHFYRGNIHYIMLTQYWQSYHKLHQHCLYHRLHSMTRCLIFHTVQSY